MAISTQQLESIHLIGLVSWDLGNAMHCDDDGDRSFACWVSRNRQWSGRPLSRHWHLLFPRHGLVVTLVHGTWISWDGVAQPHCTAVPAVAPGDELYSAFCSISAPTVTSLTRTNHCEAVMRERAAPSRTAYPTRPRPQKDSVAYKLSY